MKKKTVEKLKNNEEYFSLCKNFCKFCDKAGLDEEGNSLCSDEQIFECLKRKKKLERLTKKNFNRISRKAKRLRRWYDPAFRRRWTCIFLPLIAVGLATTIPLLLGVFNLIEWGFLMAGSLSVVGLTGTSIYQGNF